MTQWNACADLLANYTVYLILCNLAENIDNNLPTTASISYSLHILEAVFIEAVFIEAVALVG